MSIAKTQPRKPADHLSHDKARSDVSPFKQAFEVLAEAISAQYAVIITTLPRASLQIAQSAKLPEGLLRSYARQFHLEDRLTWQAILGGRALNASEVLGDEHVFVREFLNVNDIVHAAAAPLRAPIITGYAGAIHLYRTAEQGPFSADDIHKLGETAQQIDEIIEKAREARQGDDEPKITLTPRPKTRLFAFNARGEQLLSPEEFNRLDVRLREGMIEQSRAGLNRLNGELITSDRVQLADSRGDLWNFRMVVYSRYPAMGQEPVALFAMQPSCAEWASVRPSDLQADAELARLIPALKFMREEYHRGPTLGEIAKQVHLSPFHFHRRFAELLGLTPKHYLLECQINAAKVELLSGKKELAQIAADCGFAHQSHFTSRFKQATGLTPTRWRRQAQDAHRS